MDSGYRPLVELRHDALVMGLLAAMLLLGLLAWPHLPARVPVHWAASGQVNGWSTPAFAVLFLPALAVGVWLLLVVVPAIDPRRRNYAQFRGTYRMIRASVVALLAAIHTAALAAGLGSAPPVPVVLPMMLAALLLVLGNLMPRVRPNWFAGIRTPWTLSSDETWRRTHRLGGRLMMAGAALPLLALPAGGRALLELTVAGALVPVVAASVYSYVIYQALERGTGS